MAVETVFSAVDRNVKKELGDQTKAAARLKQQYEANVKEVRNFESAGRQAMRSVRTESERYGDSLRGLRQLQRQGNITQEQAVSIARRLRREIEAQASPLRLVRSELAQFIGGWALAHRAASLVTAEISRQVDFQRQAADISGRFAEGQRAVTTNLVQEGADPDRLRALFGRLENAALQTATNPSVVLGESAKAISATGGSLDERLAIAEDKLVQVLPFFRGAEQNIGDFVGSFIDFSRTAVDEVGVSNAEAAALFVQAQSQIRVSDIANLKNLVPAVAAADVTSDLDLENLKASIALFGAIGARLSEETGQTTATAEANFLRVLRDEFGEQTTILQRIDAFRSAGDSRQQEVIERFLGRAITKTVQEEFALDPDSATGRQFNAILGSLDPNEDLLQRAKEFLFSGTGDLGNQSIQETLTSVSELQFRDEALAGVLRRALFTGTDRAPGLARATNQFGAPGLRAMFELSALFGDEQDVAATGLHTIGILRSELNESGASPQQVQALNRIEAVLRSRLEPNNRNRPPAIEVGD